MNSEEQETVELLMNRLNLARVILPPYSRPRPIRSEAPDRLLRPVAA